MRRPVPGNGFAPRSFFRRLERASARMTPYLVMLAIGLALVNLTGLLLLAPHLTITRHSADQIGAPSEAGCRIEPAIDARLMSGT